MCSISHHEFSRLRACCLLQLYLALSGVLASGGEDVMTALANAEADIASLSSDGARSKVRLGLHHRLRISLASRSPFIVEHTRKHTSQAVR